MAPGHETRLYERRGKIVGLTEAGSAPSGQLAGRPTKGGGRGWWPGPGVSPSSATGVRWRQKKTHARARWNHRSRPSQLVRPVRWTDGTIGRVRGRLAALKICTAARISVSDFGAQACPLHSVGGKTGFPGPYHPARPGGHQPKSPRPAQLDPSR